MAVIDGITERLSGDPVQGRQTLLSVLPSLFLHGAVAAAIWLGLATRPERIQPPITFVSIAPAAAPAESLPLPPTGMRLPQPATEARAEEPPLDFALSPPESESFPFDPNATRPTPEPEPKDAVPVKKAVAKKPEQPKARPEKAKPNPKPKEERKRTAAAPPAPGPVKASPAQVPVSPSATTAPAKPAANPAQSAAVSDAPVRVTNPNYAGACPIAYPERARKRNQEGTVVIHALIGPDGKPIEVSVTQSSGHRLLDAAAQEAIAGCAFVPQKVGGRAVRAIVEIPIPFKLI